MFTYYIGNVREKRHFFRRKRENAALADNCDVLADFRLNGKVCFVLGDIPYADMRVGEYLGYALALTTKLPLGEGGAKDLLRKAGLRIGTGKKMGRLSRLQFRAVMLAASLAENKREIYINLDGIAYSLFAKYKMNVWLSRLGRRYNSVHVAVSDYRFIPAKANVVSVTADGEMRSGMSKSTSYKFGRLHFSRRKCRKNPMLSDFNGKVGILCDN